MIGVSAISNDLQAQLLQQQIQDQINEEIAAAQALLNQTQSTQTSDAGNSSFSNSSSGF